VQGRLIGRGNVLIALPTVGGHGCGLRFDGMFSREREGVCFGALLCWGFLGL
jgi:hypothetical protein